jgi:hypothetical protein
MLRAGKRVELGGLDELLIEIEDAEWVGVVVKETA